MITGSLSSDKTDTRVGYKVNPTKPRDAKEPASCLRRCPFPFQKPGRILNDGDHSCHVSSVGSDTL